MGVTKTGPNPFSFSKFLFSTTQHNTGPTTQVRGGGGGGLLLPFVSRSGLDPHAAVPLRSCTSRNQEDNHTPPPFPVDPSPTTPSPAPLPRPPLGPFRPRCLIQRRCDELPNGRVPLSQVTRCGLRAALGMTPFAAGGPRPVTVAGPMPHPCPPTNPHIQDPPCPL